MMYAEVIERWFDKYAHTNGSRDECYENQRFLLVERSIYETSYYVTTHASPEDAARYHDEQEYPEDWALECLVDMQTERTFYAVPHTEWEAFPESPGQAIA